MLACGGNPARDLGPLREVPLEQLDIGDIPLTRDNLAVLHTLPIGHLCSTLSALAVDRLLAAHPTLQTWNAHRLAHVAPLLPRLRTAVSAFRRDPLTPPPSQARLRPLATAVGAVHYLALPITCSRAEAEAFSRWQGGTIACPATREQHEALFHYLAAITSTELSIHYHLGLRIDRAAHTVRWCNGMPYTWHHWSSSASAPGYFPPGEPCLTLHTSADHSEWEIDSESLYHKYLLIEWDE
jgi:hypothetical protein